MISTSSPESVTSWSERSSSNTGSARTRPKGKSSVSEARSATTISAGINEEALNEDDETYASDDGGRRTDPRRRGASRDDDQGSTRRRVQGRRSPVHGRQGRVQEHERQCE